MNTQIKAEELRINNWVFNEYTRQPQQVYPMMIAQVASLQREGKEGMMSGLPITEELLLKAGFVKTSEVTWSFGYEKTYAVFSLDGLTYNGVQGAWWYHGLLEKQPEYIHQLQNLYFALTGKELTL